MHVVSQLLPQRVCQISSKLNKFQRKRTSEEKSARSKKHKFHEMVDLLCFQWKNLESKGAWEVEPLHVPNQLSPLCVCQKSSKSNIFESKRASEEKSGQTKKIKFHEMPDILCFQGQNPLWRGAQEKEALHVANELLPLCVCQISSKSNNFPGKRASEEKWSNEKAQISRDAQFLCFQWQNIESRGA